MHVEDYMNETPACLLAMLTQTREDLAAGGKSANGARRHAYYPDRSAAFHHGGALTASLVYAAVVRATRLMSIGSFC